MRTPRIKTKYPGVYYREAARIASLKGQTERVYYVTYKKNGKLIEEKVGRQFADNMTEAKANLIRAERIEGKIPSRREIREAAEAAKAEERSKVSIGQIWTTYQEIRATKKSLATDRYIFKHLEHLADKKVADLRTIDIERLRISLENQGLKPATVKHVLVLLRLLINWAVKQAMCKQPDPSLLHFEMPKLDNERTEMLTDEQIEALKKALDEEEDQRQASIFRLALVTGMRKGAILKLKWEDCDFINRIITLSGESAKNGKTSRIPMNDAAFEILHSLDTNDSVYIFPGRGSNDKPLEDVKRMAKRIKERAGLPDDFRPMHGLRHTYASILVSSGKVDLYTVQKLMTHSSAKMTQRYAHLADEAMMKASSIMNDVFKK